VSGAGRHRGSAPQIGPAALFQVPATARTSRHNVRERISLGTTKTGVVYRLQEDPPQSHE
jgi:hypothetical protein